MDGLQEGSAVFVAEKQTHGNISLITSGELISVQGNQAVVMLEGEDVPRSVSVASVSPAEPVLGNMSGLFNEMPVIDMTPRR